MSSKFEIFKDKAGEYRFHLLAPNGQIILASQGYNQKESALNGIESVRKNAPSAEIVEIEGEPETAGEMEGKARVSSAASVATDTAGMTGKAGEGISTKGAAAAAGVAGLGAGAAAMAKGGISKGKEDISASAGEMKSHGRGLSGMDKLWGLIGAVLAIVTLAVVLMLIF